MGRQGGPKTAPMGLRELETRRGCTTHFGASEGRLWYTVIMAILFIACVILGLVFTKSFRFLTALLVVFVFGGFAAGCAMACHGAPLVALAGVAIVVYLGVRVIKHIYT